MLPTVRTKRKHSRSVFHSLSLLTLSLVGYSSGSHAILVTQQVTFASSGQSMWGSGGSTQFSNLEDPLFLGTSWGSGYNTDNSAYISGQDKSLKRRDAVSGTIFNVGTAKEGSNGVKVSGATTGKIGIKTGLSIDSGTVNTRLPFEFTLDAPDRLDLVSGKTFEFGVSNMHLDGSAFLETISPTMQLYADLIVEAQASVTAKGCYDIWFDSDCGSTTKKLIDIDSTKELLSVNIGKDREAAVKDGEIRVLDGFKELFAAGATVAELDDRIDSERDPNDPKKQKVSIDLKPKVDIGSGPIVEIDVRIPDISERSTLGGSGQSVGSSGVANVLSTSGSDDFLDLNIDVDALGTKLGILPPLGGSASVDFGVGSISANIDLLDLDFKPTLNLDQEFSLSIDSVDVRYEFDRTVLAGLAGGTLSNRNSISVSDITDKIDVTWTDGLSIGITPIYSVQASLTNKTGLSVDFDFNIDILKGSVSGEVFGFDAGSASFGPLASLPFDLGGFTLPPLFEDSFSLGGFGSARGAKIAIAISESVLTANNGIWTDSGAWDGNTPNSNTDVQVGGLGRTQTVTVNLAGSSAGNLSVLTGGNINIGSGKSLSVYGDEITNDSNINVTGGALNLSSSTVSGDGNINLRNGGTLSSVSGLSDVDLRGQKIVTSGSSASINNINLELYDTSVLSNSAATLNLVNTSIRKLSGEQFTLTGSQVNLTNTTLTGVDLDGNFTVLGSVSNNQNVWDSRGTTAKFSGKLEINNSTGGTNRMQIENRLSPSITIENDGQIIVRETSSNTTSQLRLNDTNATFTGNGSVQLLGNNAYLLHRDGTGNLVNDLEHTIKGYGIIQGFDGTQGFTNKGYVWADVNNGTLEITDSKVTNQGTMGATNNGTLNINALALSNATITQQNGSGFNDDIGRMTLDGGTWIASNSGTINFDTGDEINDRFVNRADISLIGPRADITVTGRSNAFLGSSQVTNSLDEIDRFINGVPGKLTLVANNFDSSQFDNYGQLYISSGARVSGLQNYAGGLIQGSGTLEGRASFANATGSFVNSGTIRAQGGQLNIVVPGNLDGQFTNNGIIEVMQGSQLSFSESNLVSMFSSGDTFSGGGTWAAYAGDGTASIEFNPGNLFGGGVEKLGDVNLILSGNGANFIARASNGQQLYLHNTLKHITSNGTLDIQDGKFFSNSNALLNEGNIKLNDGYFSGQRITNKGEISGFGNIFNDITNEGTVRAQDGQLLFTRSINNVSSSANVVVGGQSGGEYGDELRMSNGSISGGTVTVKTNTQLSGTGSLNNVKLVNSGTVVANRGGNLNLNTATGSSNTGTIGAQGGTLNLSGQALNNTNGIILADQSNVVLQNFVVLGGNVDVVGINAALRGYGRLDNVEINVTEGAITADANGQRLVLDPSSAAQLLNATLSAQSGGILLLTNGDFEGAGATLIRAQNGSIVELQNVSLNGIKLVTQGSGKIVDIASSQLTNVTIDGNAEVASTGKFNLNGTNILSGSLTAVSGGEIVLHDARLTGQNAELRPFVRDPNDLPSDEPDPEFEIVSVVTPGDLTIKSGATLRGSGLIDLVNLTNNGLIHADAANALSIDVQGDTFTNDGTILATGAGGLNLLDKLVVNKGDVTVESELNVADEYRQEAGSTRVNGVMRAGSLIISNGNLSGEGSIESFAQVSQTGNLNASNMLDSLTFEDDLELFGSASFDLFSDGSSDTLTVNGDLSFSETTMLIFELAADVELFPNLTFEFLYVQSILNFDLLTTANVSFNRSLDAYHWLLLWNDAGDTLSITFVDEPAQLALLMLGLAYLVRRRNQKMKR